MTCARQPRTLRDRLRLAAFAMLVLIVTTATAMHLGGPATSPFQHLFGDDFLPSYMAGTFVRQGRVDLLTDPNAAEQFQASLRQQAGLQQHGRTGPWLNPPFYAAVFVPLSALPYRAALWTWLGLNLLMLSASILLLYRMLPADSRRRSDAAILAALLLVSMPCLQAMACQQNTFLSLLILCGAISCARGDRPLAAGAVGALLLFKPQLAVIVCGALVCTLGWRALIGMAATAAVLLLASALFLPGAISDYLHKLPALLPYLRTDRPYFWERQTTFLGFWRMLLGGRTGGPNPMPVTLLWLIGSAAVAATLARPCWNALRRRISGIPRDRLLGATIAAAPLMMPYYMDYDLLLLSVPAVLLAAERIRTGRQAGDGWLIAGWVAVYGWLYLNAAVADATGISLIVLLMVVRFAMPVRSVLETGADTTEEASSPAPPVPQAASGSNSDSPSRHYLLGTHRSADSRRFVTPLVTPVAAALLAVLLAISAGVLDRSSPLTFGHDLLPSYTAGCLVLEGRAAEIYSSDATRSLGRSIVASQNLTSEPDHVLFINPAALALCFAPLSAMPYRIALLVWLGINAALATAALRIVHGWIANRRAAFWLGVAALTSCPFLLAVEHQQNTFLSLAILTAAVTAWRGNRPMVAGMLVGLLACKPQLAVAMAVVLMVCEGRRAIAGLAVGGLAVLLAGEVIAPGSTLTFLTTVPGHAAYFQQHSRYNWGRQMTPTAMLQSWLGPASPAAGIAGCVVPLAFIAALALLTRRWTCARCSGLPQDRPIVLAMLAMPLCAPYFMDYDLLLMVIPMALILKDGRTRFVAIAGGPLFLLLYLNVDLVALTGVNAVALWMLAVVAVLVCDRRFVEGPVRGDDLGPTHSLSLQPACP